MTLFTNLFDIRVVKKNLQSCPRQREMDSGLCIMNPTDLLKVSVWELEMRVLVVGVKMVVYMNCLVETTVSSSRSTLHRSRSQDRSSQRRLSDATFLNA